MHMSSKTKCNHGCQNMFWEELGTVFLSTKPGAILFVCILHEFYEKRGTALNFIFPLFNVSFEDIPYFKLWALWMTTALLMIFY